jgi:hypothetical protein
MLPTVIQVADESGGSAHTSNFKSPLLVCIIKRPPSVAETQTITRHSALFWGVSPSKPRICRTCVHASGSPCAYMPENADMPENAELPGTVDVD